MEPQLMSEADFRERYYEAIGIAPTDSTWPEAASKALERAHKVRELEIELYWKRATYFWAFQVVAFATLGLLLRGEEPPSSEAVLATAALGTFTAVAGYLIARGSKFWQDSWEAHVDMLEPADEARLSQVIVLREAPQFSVTRVNQYLLQVIALWWTAIVLLAAFPDILLWVIELPEWVRSWSALALLALAISGLLFGCRSRISGRAWMGSGQWENYTSTRTRAQPKIIWRNRAES
jgi:hypothetical protein